jgi:non-specific serine/threonine protein kinase/serine/threonine-protein kinase
MESPMADDASRSITVSDDLPDDPLRLGRYRVLQKIGEGGFGEIWVADQTEPVRRRVAIKVLKAGMDTKAVLARFEAERQALAMMDHPNIAKVFDAGETERGRPFFVMELVKGEAITDYCDRHALGTRERLELFLPVCSAVQHAHQKGIIHRDLKPSNILIAHQDDGALAKVIDFGIAKATHAALTERTIYTQQGQLIGTPAYMSPEQAEMGGLDVDTRTDVYSLGIILYELLAGAPPFPPETLATAGYSEIQRIIREQEPPRPSTRVLAAAAAGVAEQRRTTARALARELREDLDWIVLKAIEKDRTRRYAGPSALARDVERHLHHEPVEAGPPSARYRFRKFVRRHTLGAGIALTALLGLLTVAATMTVQARRIARERDRVAVEAKTASEVSEFLIDLFEVSDPGEARGNTVTAREILDEGAERIRADLDAQPVVRARLMGVMARVYRALGLYGPAEPLAREALDVRRRELGDDDPETLGALHDLAIQCWNQGRYDEAEPLFQEAMERERRVFGDEDPRTLRLMNSVANLYSDQGRYPEAESLYLFVVDARRRTAGLEDRETLRAMGNLALLYYDQARYADAEPLYLETLEAQRRVLGADHPETVDSLNNLGILYWALGRFGEAEGVYAEALEARLRVQGPDHPRTLGTMNNLALLKHFQKKYDEAEPLYRETLEGKRRTLGPDHHQTMSSMINLALLYNDQGRWEESETVYRQALDIARRTLGEENPETLTTRLNLAILYMNTGRHDEAEPILRETLAAQRKVLGDAHPETLVSMVSLARVAAARGRPQPALELLESASALGLADGSVAEQPEFRELRDDPGFLEIVAAIAARVPPAEAGGE